MSQRFSPSEVALLARKGVFPYEYMTGPAVLEETSLPPREAFYSQLKQEHVSQADYEHGQEVWRVFNMQTLGDYQELYVLTDVLLLADVFQSFRKTCLDFYKLDPAHYYTSPGLSWDAALRHTDVKLELLTDIDQYLFVESAIRGGVSVITQRYAKANNSYLPGFDSAAPSTYIQYLDVNNLYGKAMQSSLPVGGFQWIEPESFNLDLHPDDDDLGFFLQVDLEYPAHLHDSHNSLPLAPEIMAIEESELSSYSTDLLAELHFKHMGSCKKLVPSLKDKAKYTLHFANLRFYLSQGMVLKKIHKILQFQQRPWLKSYIDFNTSKRAVAKTAFEKDLFKLLNNAVFGKSMENVRKHTNIELVNDAQKLRKKLAKPSFRRARVFKEELVAVEQRRVTVQLDKPIYTGAAILDLSKIVVYKFHYEHMLPRYGSNARLLFTDTDSLTYEIQTGDVYRDMLQDAHLYDLSEYPEDHFLYSETNKKVVGVMKDECAKTVAREFCGLRPKCYSIKTSCSIKKTAKGVTKATRDRVLRHNMYKRCLFYKQVVSAANPRIVHHNHELYMVKPSKLCLSATDDKRFVLPNGVHTLAHGHYAIPLLESGDKTWEEYYHGFVPPIVYLEEDDEEEKK